MAKKKKLRMGFLGHGFVGPTHGDAIGLNHDIAISYAVADDDPEKRKLAREAGYVTFSSAEKLIANSYVDAVHITGPDRFHKDWSIAAMDAGKKIVVCEKPMTLTLEESIQVLDRAERFEKDTGGVFMTNINYMGHALPRAIRELHNLEYFGDPTVIIGTYLQDWLQDPNVWNWRLEGPMCASRDTLPHLVSAAYFMFGAYPVKLMADSAVVIPERMRPASGRADTYGGSTDEEVKEKVEVESDLYTNVTIHFNNGAHGYFTVAQCMPGKKNNWELTVAGRKRTAIWNQTNPNVLEIGQVLIKDTNDPKDKIYDPGEVGNIKIINDPGTLEAIGCFNAKEYSPYPGEHPAGHIDAFARNFREAYHVAMGKKDRSEAVIPGATIGHVCVAVADAVLRSKQAGGEWVKVDYKGVDLSTGKL